MTEIAVRKPWQWWREYPFVWPKNPTALGVEDGGKALVLDGEYMTGRKALMVRFAIRSYYQQRRWRRVQVVGWAVLVGLLLWR